MKFNERLKEIRTDKNLTMQQLAKELNYSIISISRWESGKRIPNADVIVKYAQFFEVSADYILGLSDY